MSPRRLLILSSVFGVLTAGVLNLYVAKVESRQQGVSVLRITPGISLEPGAPIDPARIETVELPERFGEIIRHAVPGDAEALAWIRDLELARPVSGGSLLRYEHFERDSETGLGVAIEPEHRALSIPVDRSTAVSYFIEPGSRVDVLVTVLDDRREEQEDDVSLPSVTTRSLRTTTLLQNVRVLAIGRATSRDAYLEADPGDFRTVTVEVTPLEAETIVFALENAEPRRELTLVLRNPADRAERTLPSVGWEALAKSR